MAAVLAPVTPDVVRWAVEEDGRDAPALAEALKVDEDTFLAWLEGDAKPTKGQVTRLAEVLRRPRALFFLPTPPAAATLPASYRHPPGAQRDVSQAARLHLRRARRVQDAVAWTLRDEPEVELPRHALTEDAAAAGEAVREWTGITVEEQYAWTGGPYTALNAWRQAFDRLGILVFSIEVGRGDVRGFSSWNPRAPLIAVNVSAVSPSARVFTLAHELGHLVTRTDAACIEPMELLVDVDVERWCEAFAAAFLMPSGAVRRLARLHGFGLRPASVADVSALMRYFHVSARAAALRLIELGYAEPRFYGEVEAVFRPKPAAETPDQSGRRNAPRDVQRERELGPRALREVMNGLPEQVALRVLRLTVDDARKIADRVPGVRDSF